MQIFFGLFSPHSCCNLFIFQILRVQNYTRLFGIHDYMENRRRTTSVLPSKVVELRAQCKVATTLAGMQWHSTCLYQWTVSRRTMAVTENLVQHHTCFSNATNRRLSIIVIEFNGYRSQINPPYYRWNIACNYLSQTRFQCYAKFKFSVRRKKGGYRSPIAP